MEKNIFQLEDFPNEILMEILKNLDVQNLFQAFYHLNFRFNTLLHSVNDLTYTISENNSDDSILRHFPIHHISTLMINAEISVDLERFTHIRCLILVTRTDVHIEQLLIQTLPSLEHLSINFPNQSSPYDISEIINKIFSNGYPRLQSFYLSETEAITENNLWMQVLSLRKLIVGKINIIAYKAILTSCPNLYFFKFIKYDCKETTLPPSEPHINLKRMIIALSIWLLGTKSDISIYLSCVPNLEQLSIHHEEFDTHMKEYLFYDWLSSSIMHYLPFLRRFNYYLKISRYGLRNTSNIENNLHQMKEDFKNVHNDQYQSRLMVIQRL
jgi:hypothetical protein